MVVFFFFFSNVELHKLGNHNNFQTNYLMIDWRGQNWVLKMDNTHRSLTDNWKHIELVQPIYQDGTYTKKSDIKILKKD